MFSHEDDIHPDVLFKKMLIIRFDIKSGSLTSIKFNKRPKKIWEINDPNAISFSYNKIELIDLAAENT